jgi:archaeal type IV pilus assembly protein PilA
MNGKTQEQAVSPVVGVMMMLVVTIIIAAIVSAFAGGAVSGQKKTAQATIYGKFSVANGMEISHAGGDALATNDLVFMIRDNSVFGPNLEQTTAQLLDKKNISNANGKYMLYADGSMDFTSFVSGDTLYISADNTTCNIFQPGIAPDATKAASWDGYKYTGSKAALWALCIRNPDNVGKTFSLEVSDKKGNLISKSDVTIAS